MDIFTRTVAYPLQRLEMGLKGKAKITTRAKKETGRKRTKQELVDQSGGERENETRRK